MTEDVKAKAMQFALKLLGPVLTQFTLAMKEARANGMSEAEIQRHITRVCKMVESEHRGKVADSIVDEMLLLLKKAALPSIKGPSLAIKVPPRREAASLGPVSYTHLTLPTTPYV